MTPEERLNKIHWIVFLILWGQVLQAITMIVILLAVIER